MKKTIIFIVGLIFLMAMSTVAFAQSTHTVDFESSGVGADWEWTISDNSTNPDLEFVANPATGGINTSATSAKFTALAAGANWALCFTDDDGEFTFDATNSTVKIMVYKPVVSVVAIKFEGTSPAIELQVSNTLTNQWEELTFDFSGSIGNTYSRIIVIPDFVQPYVTGYDRTQDNICYFDNIQVPDGVPTTLPEPEVAAPTPTNAATDVISVYSNAYTALPGTNFNPGWGQSTSVSFVDIAGNETMKYATFNYQGTQLASATDLSLMEYMHVDMWTPNATVVKVTPISVSTGEFLVALDPINSETWNSYDIPLSDFDGVSMTDIHQLKFDGQDGVSPSTIYLDNIYFWKAPASADASLSDLQVDGTTVVGFDPDDLNYDYVLDNGSSVPTVTATTNDPSATYDITDATSIPGTTTVEVTGEDGTTTQTYNVHFIPEPVAAASTPPLPGSDVISLFSNAYTDVTIDTWSTDWDQADVEDVEIAGNDAKKYTNLTYAGIEFTSPTIDATSMDNYHIDIWTPDVISDDEALKIKLVDFGPDGVWGGDDVEGELTFDGTTSPALISQQWISFDIPLSEFYDAGMTTRAHLAQLILSGVNSLNTLYVDNVYLYSGETLPVTLSQFTATFTENKALIAWTTATETNVEGFNLYRNTQYEFSTAEKINVNLIPGHGTTSDPNFYEFEDLNPVYAGTTYYYWLQSVDFSATTEVYNAIQFKPEEGQGGYDNTFDTNSLSCFPNPAKNSIAIDYAIKGRPVTSPVTVNIYNILGEVVKTKEINSNQNSIDISDFNSGIYFYQIDEGGFNQIKKMVIID